MSAVVVVVGGGSAGLGAAVAAAETGAEVHLLERSTEEEAGGNARFSHTGFRMPYGMRSTIRDFLPDVPKEQFDRFVLPGFSRAAFATVLNDVTGGRIDGRLRDTLVNDAEASMRWMLGLGIKWSPNRSTDVDGRTHFEPGLVLAAGGGLGGPGLIAQWLDIAARSGVLMRFGATAVDVELERGHVRRVAIATGPEGRRRTDWIDTAAVVIASGGFQANRDLCLRYLGNEYSRAVVRGAGTDTGELTERLIERGVGRGGSWNHAVTTPVDRHSPPIGGGNTMNRYSYPYGITVNRDGRRFLDEGAGSLGDTYGQVGRAILRQPGGIAFQIFDAQGTRHLKEYAYRHARPIRADSIADLAAHMGVDGRALEQTVADFNRAVPRRPDFDPTRLDGRSTEGRLHPPKSNWAVTIAAPPFVAYEVTGGLTFTLGGVLVDSMARVLDQSGAPVRGVYATGDAIGLFHLAYPSGAGQTRNVVFGRLAGIGAAAGAGGSPG